MIYIQVPSDGRILDLLGQIFRYQIEQSCRDCRAVVASQPAKAEDAAPTAARTQQHVLDLGASTVEMRSPRHHSSAMHWRVLTPSPRCDQHKKTQPKHPQLHPYVLRPKQHLRGAQRHGQRQVDDKRNINTDQCFPYSPNYLSEKPRQ